MSTKIESEKDLEKLLQKECKKIGGWAIKLLPFQNAGLPDRMCLFPGGKIFFVEVKTTFKKPTLIQQKMIGKIRALGFVVAIVDCTDDIHSFIEYVINN